MYCVSVSPRYPYESLAAYSSPIVVAEFCTAARRYPVYAGLPALRYQCECNQYHFPDANGICIPIPETWTAPKLVALVLGCVALSLLLAALIKVIFRRQKQLRHNLDLHIGLLEDSQ